MNSVIHTAGSVWKTTGHVIMNGKSRNYRITKLQKSVSTAARLTSSIVNLQSSL